MVMGMPKHSDPAQNPLWVAALPVAESIYRLAETWDPRASPELRERLRRSMASAMSCVSDAIENSGQRMACAYLAGAERMVQRVLEDLCHAYERNILTDEEYTRVFGLCGRLCTRLEGHLLELPEGSRDTVMISSYAALYLSDPSSDSN